MGVTSNSGDKIEAALVYLQPTLGLNFPLCTRRAVGLIPRAFLNLKVDEFQFIVLNL